MQKTVRITIAQINTTVGDLDGNTERILVSINQARQRGVDIIVFPELTITGYPPEDLIMKHHFIDENLKCLNKITKAVKDIIAVVGFIDKSGNGIYNSAGILVNRKVLYVYHKRHLPDYGVFDEKRYFKQGRENVVLKTKDFSFAVNICEDIWGPEDSVEKKILSQGQFLINISASPYHIDKINKRRAVISKKAREFKIPIIYCNLIGGQDELVFDGGSVVFSKKGELIAEGKAFEEDLVLVDLPIDAKRKVKRNSKIEVNIDYSAASRGRLNVPCLLGRVKGEGGIDVVEEVYSALTLGVCDYVRKNNFNKVTFGLSGGIDSALVACIAVDAVGRENVLAVSMPSVYSSKATQGDAEKISSNFGIKIVRIAIDDIFNAYIGALKTHFVKRGTDITEENIQARIRGNILMAFSNKFRYIVLNTGNKSETSVGYCTLYGDMAGGFAVIKDVPKGLVYELARYVNNKKGKEIIPKSVFVRAPSAELKYGQRDEDILPSYELLDKIIDLYIEKNVSFSKIVQMLGNKDVVRNVLRMIDMNEYKRRQSPPGIKISPKAFGKDRRMPITNKFIV